MENITSDFKETDSKPSISGEADMTTMDPWNPDCDDRITIQMTVLRD